MATGTRRGRSSTTKTPDTSPGNDFSTELAWAGDRRELLARIERVRAALLAGGLRENDWSLVEVGRAAKKNFAQAFSTAIAQKTANALRPRFKGIWPDAAGKGHESKSAGASGLKKLDVNYSTPTIGLGLAVSIKTTNFKDDVTGRYTKNVRRVDGELRAEAQDCHNRQPFAVLVALWFLPADAATDGSGEGGSSIVHAANVLARRSGRTDKSKDESLFELAFIATYDDAGAVDFFPAGASFPASGLPAEPLDFAEVLRRIEAAFAARNQA